MFCFHYITSTILIHAFLCTSARRFCVSVCVCVFMHPCVGECGGRGTLSTVPQDPSIFFLVVEAKSFPWSLLIQAVSSRPPPVSSSLMLELQADTTQLFFFFFFRAFWRSNSCGKRFTDRAVSLFPHGNMKSELACPRRHIFSQAGGCRPNALQHSLLYPGSGSLSVAMIKVTCLRKGLF